MDGRKRTNGEKRRLGDAYRQLFKEYFAGGARWTAAPRPQLPDELFDASYRVPEPEEAIRYII